VHIRGTKVKTIQRLGRNSKRFEEHKNREKDKLFQIGNFILFYFNLIRSPKVMEDGRPKVTRPQPIYFHSW